MWESKITVHSVKRFLNCVLKRSAFPFATKMNLFEKSIENEFIWKNQMKMNNFGNLT